MRVLFISSGNSIFGISPIVRNQGESLRGEGITIAYYTIKGKGLRGYLNNIKPLRDYLELNEFDIIHAHYSMSAFVASLAGAKPLVVSLMGSDVKSEKIFKLFMLFFNIISWTKIIVKSDDMKDSLGIKNVEVVPNGVDITKFKPLDKKSCKEQLGWDLNKKQILFAANPNRPEKNFNLAKSAVDILNDSKIELKVLKDVPNELMPLYHNAADVVLLTSLWEGSPNVIKEAMACNRPIISTPVGDTVQLLNKVNNAFIVNFESKEIMEKLQILLYCDSSNGRNSIEIMGLDSVKKANKIIKLYKNINNES